MGRGVNEEKIAEAQRMLDERAARKAAEKAEKEAERKRKWDFYHEQLAKGTPFVSGGAKRINRNRRARTFRFGKDN